MPSGLDQPVTANRALQQRARHDLDGVHGIVEHVGMAPLRAALARTQARHVHAQGAAGGDIEQLRASAGGKERLLGAKHLVNQLKLKTVANLAAQRGVVGRSSPQRLGLTSGPPGIAMPSAIST